MSIIEVYNKDNTLIAEFKAYCDESEHYYAAACKHESTRKALIELGWPADKPYQQFFEEAYGHVLLIDDDILSCAWPKTKSEDERDRAIVDLTKLPKVAKVIYKDNTYTKVTPIPITTSECIKGNNKVKFVLDTNVTLIYTVHPTYLSLGGCNDRLFTHLNITNKFEFMQTFYGYSPYTGMWPEYRSNDYAWWPKFAKEIIKRGIKIYINNVLYEPPKDTSEESDIERVMLKADSATQCEGIRTSTSSKSLQYDSEVTIITKINTYTYKCKSRYLSCRAMRNNQVFRDVKINADEFCKICYGYQPVSGYASDSMWPESREHDYDALYKALCGIVYANIGRVYINDIEIKQVDALKTLSSWQMSRLSELVAIHDMCDEVQTKSDVPQNHTNIEVSHEIKLTNISYKHKVQL